MNRAEIFAALGKTDDDDRQKNAVYNVLSIARSHGFITTDYDSNHAITRVKLTSKGSQALGRGVWGAIESAVPKPPVSPAPQKEHKQSAQDVPETVTLKLATEVTDAFNKQDPYWEWRLVRKGSTPM